MSRAGLASELKKNKMVGKTASLVSYKMYKKAFTNSKRKKHANTVLTYACKRLFRGRLEQ